MNSNQNHIMWSIYTKDCEQIRTLSWSKYTEAQKTKELNLYLPSQFTKNSENYVQD